MPGLATKPHAMSFEDGGENKQPKRSTDFDFEVAMSKFRELQATKPCFWARLRS
jgi:hypothetical protein